MSSTLIFGELLFDQFESGETVLGGAPMNVAWHLQGLGLHPTLISRIGNDPLGERALEALRLAGIDIDAIQLDKKYPTGTVRVKLRQGTPSFEIVQDVAYDQIQIPDDATMSKTYRLLYHGSLALRSATSRDTLAHIRNLTGCPVFVDINLRPPFWEKTFIQQLIRQADWVKLNNEELLMLIEHPVTQDRQALIALARTLREANRLKALIVTCGADGAFIVSESEVVDMPPVKPVKIVDTVGAGDGFSAIVIAGLLQGWDYPRILAQASQFAAKICAIRGAIPASHDFYSELQMPDPT
jgi:fructokinase